MSRGASRIIAAALGIALAVGGALTGPLAATATETATDGDFEFSYDATTGDATVTGWTGTGSELSIPGMLDGHPVTGIGIEAFASKALTAVTIPDSITTIERSAFAVDHLLDVTIPDSVTTIGEYAFYDNQLMSLTLPESVTSIGGGAFSNNPLVSATLPGSLAAIGPRAFFEGVPLSVAFLGDAPAIVQDAGPIGSFGDGTRTTVYYDSDATGWSQPWHGYGTISGPAPITHIVTFAPEDGDPVVRRAALDGTEVGAPDSPTRKGYAFAGWFTDSDLTAAYDFNAPVIQDLTLHAAWSPNHYTISFDPNGASADSTPSMTAIYDVEVQLNANGFALTGYAFEGWNTKRNGTGTSYADGATVIDLTTAGTATLYAQWMRQSFETALKFKQHPGISMHGAPVTGQTVTATTSGRWSPASPTIQYVWLLDGVVAHVGKHFTLPNDSAGKALVSQVVATHSGEYAVFLDSKPVTVKQGFDLLGTPTITSSASSSARTTAGSRLTANPGLWLAPPDALRYQWYRAGKALKDKAKQTYTVSSADYGRKITVKVTAVKSGWVSASKTSAALKVPKHFAKHPKVSISGTVAVGHTVTAKRSGKWSPSKHVSTHYQWYLDGIAIEGATESKHKLRSSEVGDTLTVRISGSRSGYRTQSVTSTAKTVLDVFANAPVVYLKATKIKIDDRGTTDQSRRLGLFPLPYDLDAPDYAFDDWAPAATSIKYRWYRNGKHVGDGASTILFGFDIGDTFTVKVTAKRPGFLPVSKTSKKVTIGKTKPTGPGLKN